MLFVLLGLTLSAGEEKELLKWENINADEFLRKRDWDEKEATDKIASNRCRTIPNLVRSL